MRILRRPTFFVALAVLFGAAPACFPDFEVPSGDDGGPGGGSPGGPGHADGGGPGGGSTDGTIQPTSDGNPGNPTPGQDSSVPPPTQSDGAPAAGDGGSAPYDAGTQALIPHGGFTFIDFSGQGMTAATLTNDTLFDKYEVTTAQFDAWLTAGAPVPADGQSLDPGGPYDGAMFWQGGNTWSNYAASILYKDATNCNEVQALESNDEPPSEYSVFGPTYVIYTTANKTGPSATYPINCVNFYQALAYCWWAGQKRLPVEAEWQYEITGRGRSYTYPWGNSPDPTDCTLAIWRGSTGTSTNNYNGCGWPKGVGSAPAGASLDGVFDMQGSVEEWIWNSANNEFPPAWPPNYSGPSEDGGTVDMPRTARSGSFFTSDQGSPNRNMDGRVYDNFGTPSGTTYADLGFRCAKSRL